MELPVINNTARASESRGCASSGCGTAPDALGHLPDHIRAKVQDHPCYSDEAHHYLARMHVAFAPACNIQCNYCNRKYDCSNESRPDVVSELLTLDQADQEGPCRRRRDSADDGPWHRRTRRPSRQTGPHLRKLRTAVRLKRRSLVAVFRRKQNTPQRLR